MRKSRTGILIDKVFLALHGVKTPYKKAKYARKRVKMIQGGYNGSQKEFQDKVVSYWKPYGIHPQKYWYDLYCAGQDEYDPRYIPDSLWYSKFLPYFNNSFFREAYDDKGYYDVIFGDLKRPNIIVRKMATHYYDGNMNLISQERAIELCISSGQWVIKGSTNSGCGRDVQFYDCGQKDDKDNVQRLFAEFQDNFVVQELVKQHPDLAKLHEQSLNTIRVQSFFFKDQVHILSCLLRIGGGDARIDNVSAGGFGCPVNLDGSLKEKAVNRKSEWVSQLPNGIVLKNVTIPSFDRMIDIIKVKHSKLPYFGLLGWDFAIDEEGEPIFIEVNIQQEQNQISCGPTFGDLTSKVLQDIFIEKSLRDVFFV